MTTFHVKVGQTAVLSGNVFITLETLISPGVYSKMPLELKMQRYRNLRQRKLECGLSVHDEHHIYGHIGLQHGQTATVKNLNISFDDFVANPETNDISFVFSVSFTNT
jgi:hypothetical protein